MSRDIKLASLNIKLASAVLHLIEHVETGHPMDWQAAIAIVKDAEVKEFLDKAGEMGLLPVPRDPLGSLQ